MNSKDVEKKRKDLLKRLEGHERSEQLERRRAEVSQRVYAARLFPDLNENQRKLAELRAQSKYDQYPQKFKDAMKDHGFEAGKSKHYCVDF